MIEKPAQKAGFFCGIKKGFLLSVGRTLSVEGIAKMLRIFAKFSNQKVLPSKARNLLRCHFNLCCFKKVNA
jgi:hypothetical protein